MGDKHSAEDMDGLGPRECSDGSLLSGESSDALLPRHEVKSDVVIQSARCIYRLRWLFFLGWPAISVLLAPCAWGLITRAAPISKTAPRGTESTAAMAIFQEHFENLAVIRREMVVFRCRTPCQSAALGPTGTMARGYVQMVVDLVKRFDQDNPGTIIQVQSYYTFSEHHQLGENPMISGDKQSILLQWLWRVPPATKGVCEGFVTKILAEIEKINEWQGPDGVELSATGLVFLDHAMEETLIEEIPVHEICTIWAPFLILAFALRSFRMLIVALIPMPIEILTSFGLMYFVSLQTTVLFYALMMMLMLCTSLSFDYALFTLTRYAEERGNGAEVMDAVITVISQSGRVVVVSGCVLMIAWASMVMLPSPFNTFALSANCMIFVCVLVQLTFVPSLLAILPFLGPPQNLTPVLHNESGDFEHGVELLQEQGQSSIGGSLGGFKSVAGGSLLSENEFGMHAEGPLVQAKPHMRGMWFCLGGWLTGFPLNILVPLIVYTAMMPLTLRMGNNFDLRQFKFHMGHGYELTIPRTRPEWRTALRIQRDFPNETGILMPMLIIATNDYALQPASLAKRPPALPPPMSYNTSDWLLPSNSSSELAVESTEVPAATESLDVRGEAFFAANCAMANSLIEATRNKSYALGADNFVSATFHGFDEATGGVKCLPYWQIHMVLDNYFAKRFFLSHTSKSLKMLWERLVSSNSHAMLTFLFPNMDPFSPEAFALTRDVREVLRNATEEMRNPDASIPGLTFTTFSPGGVLMDLIDVTSQALPLSFVGCVLVSFLLIAVWFRAIFFPIKLLMTVIVPLSWTFGAALFVYEDGHLQWTNFPGLMPVGNKGVDWTVPMFTLTFMMGLALDYEIFLFERVREFREEGFGDREAIQLGLAATGGTISCAGMIMALTFSAQLLGSIPLTNQMGFILVFSIVVDTFIVRSILVPSMLSLFPGLNYWPSKMPEPRYTWLKGLGQSPSRSSRESNHLRQTSEDEDGESD